MTTLKPRYSKQEFEGYLDIQIYWAHSKQRNRVFNRDKGLNQVFG